MVVQRDSMIGTVYLIVTMALFSTIEVAVKSLVGFIPPLRLAAIRFVGAGLLLLPFACVRTQARKQAWTRRDVFILFMLGLIGVAFALSFYHASLCFLPAGVGAVVFSANPIFVALFAGLLGEERIRPSTVVGVLLGCSGVAVVGWNQGQLETGWIPGIVFMVIAQAAFAYYSVLARRFMPRFGAMTITSAASIIGGLFLAALSRVLEGPLEWSLPGRLWMVLAYLIVGATAIPYILFFHGLVRVGAARGATFFFLKPLLAPIFAWWFLSEPLKYSLAGGAVLIVAGLLIELWPVGSAAPPD